MKYSATPPTVNHHALRLAKSKKNMRFEITAVLKPSQQSIFEEPGAGNLHTQGSVGVGSRKVAFLPEECWGVFGYVHTVRWWLMQKSKYQKKN